MRCDREHFEVKTRMEDPEGDPVVVVMVVVVVVVVVQVLPLFVRKRCAVVTCFPVVSRSLERDVCK